MSSDRSREAAIVVFGSPSRRDHVPRALQH